VLFHLRIVFMLDIQGGNVIGQEHDLVTEEIIGVFLFEDATRETTDDIDDEVASSGGWIEDLDTRGLDGSAKRLLEYDIDTFYHESDDLLRCIDNAMRVGLLD